MPRERTIRTDVMAKWKAFAKYFVHGVRNDQTGEVKKRNGAAAARAAGFSKDNAASQASKLLKIEDVQALISEEEAKEIRDLKFGDDFIIENLLEILKRCMQAEPVMVDGAATGEWQFDPKNAMVALDKLGRHIGMWSKVTDDSRAREAMDKAKQRADEIRKEIDALSKGGGDRPKNVVNMEAIRGGGS